MREAEKFVVWRALEIEMPLSVARELDCEWVVGRCKSYLERGDKHGAKAWILTARSLFPGDFSVQVVHVNWSVLSTYTGEYS